MGVEPNLPIYEAIKRSIRTKIECGELQPGDRVASEHQLANEMKVSRSQTRQALRDLEMEGYIERTPGRGSFVKPAHERRARQSGLTRPRVTCAYPRLAERAKSFHMDSLLRGFVESVSAQGFDPMFYYLEVNREAELEFLSTIQKSDVEGLAFWPQYESESEINLVRQMCDSAFPCVLFDRDLPSVEVDFVGTANQTAFRQLTHALVAQGHTTIGYLAVNAEGSVMEDRLAGYQQEVQRAGLPDDDVLIGLLDFYFDSRFRERDVDQAIARTSSVVDAMLAHKPAPSAFVIGDTWTASLTLAHLESRDVRIPEDLEMAVMDDNLDPRFPEDVPWLAAVQDGDTIGKQIAEVLLARIKDPRKPIERRLVPAKMLFEQGQRRDRCEPKSAQEGRPLLAKQRS